MRLEEYTIKGVSLGSARTTIMIKPGDILIDIGFGFNEAIRFPKLYLTHGHVDHIADLIYYVSQRKLMSMEGPQIFCPAELVEPLQQIIAHYEKIERTQYGHQIIALEANKEYNLGKGKFFMPISMNHRIPSLGYCFFQYKRKLKKEYLSLPQERILELKMNNEDIFVQEKSYDLFVTGDTNFQAVKDTPEALQSRILLIETTYVDEKKPPELAAQWGHIHLDDIWQNAALFEKNKYIVLYHFSRRYKREYLDTVINETCPISLQNKIRLFN